MYSGQISLNLPVYHQQAIGGLQFLINMPLEDKIFFLKDDGRVSNILRNDLIKIVRLIKEEINDVSIILGGSLAYGEGRYTEENDEINFLSDFDIFIIIPSLLHTYQSMKNLKLKNLTETLRLSNSVELIFVWERLLSIGITTVAGEVLVKNRKIINILNNLPVPRATNNLKRAYKYLLIGISDLSGSSEYIGKAMVQGFQTFLMHTNKDSKYEEWNRFFSLRYQLEIADSVRDFAGDDACIFLKNVLQGLLDERRKCEYKLEDFFLVREFLNKVYLEIKPVFEMNDFIRYLSFYIKNGKVPNPFINSTKCYLDATRMLVDSINNNYGFDDRKLHEGEKILNRLVGEEGKGLNPFEILKKSADKLKMYDEIYLHKVKHKINSA